MIQAHTTKEQWVLPRWLRYNSAVQTGELFFTGLPFSYELPNIESEFAAFKLSPAPLLASDLLGQAFLHGKAVMARELAEYVLTHREIRQPTRELALRILKGRETRSQDLPKSKEIALLKAELRDFPRNPTKWVDLSRLYTIAGQRDKGEDAIRKALALAPYDRFTLRSAARFFLHFSDIESAHEALNRNSDALQDTWILPIAASVSFLANKPSPLPRYISLSPASDENAFHRAELLEVFGMNEFVNGHDRVARKTLRAAWQNPNCNVVTHAEWLTRTHLSGLREQAVKESERSKAALANEHLENGRISESIMVGKEWLFEEPYSRHPYGFLTFALSLAEKFDQVIQLYNDAIQSRIFDSLIANNAAYSYLQLNKLDLAEGILAKLLRQSSDDLKYTLVATCGLFEIMSGRLESGKKLYLHACELARSESVAVEELVNLYMYLALIQAGHELSEQEMEHFRRTKRQATNVRQLAIIRQIDRKISNNKELFESKALLRGPVTLGESGLALPPF